MKFFYSSSNKALLAFFLTCPLMVNGQNQALSSNTPIPTNQSNSDYRGGDQYRTQSFGSPQSYGNNNYANSDCYEGDDVCYPCCDGGWDTMKTALIIGASAIGGGVVGGLIAGGKGHGGHDGEEGPAGPTGATGPAGPSGPGFISDLGHNLSFSLTSLFPASPAGTVHVTPFVTAPNGITIEGPGVISPAAGGTISFAPILVTNPVFGFYNFGLSIVNTSSTTLAGITLNGTLVTASRNGATTNELTPLAGVSIAPGESQVSNTFTYDSANVP